MIEDIKMWLYLRLLASELRGYLSDEYGNGNLDIYDSERKFRSEYNFMMKVENLNGRVWLALLPFKLHRYTPLKYNPLENFNWSNATINDKTKAIFESAKKLNLFDFPNKKVFSAYEPITVGFIDTQKPFKETFEEDRDYITLSYEPGNRFISYSGLFKFLYNHHSLFLAFIWMAILYTLGKIIDLYSLTCAHYSNIPIC